MVCHLQVDILPVILSLLQASRAPGYDILIITMDILLKENAYTARGPIAAVSRTCRYLRREGVKRLLSHTVRVNLMARPQSVAPFCRFVLSDAMARIPLLRRFIVDVHQLGEGDARLFAELLAQASCLEHLQIDSLLKVTKPVAIILCSAFASNSSLRHLTLSFCKTEYSCYARIFYHAFQNIRSHLTSIDITIPQIAMLGFSSLYVRDLDPIFFLSRLTESLKSVKLDGIIRVGGGVRVYPLVEELHVPSHVYHGMPDLKTYLTCFPNVTHLQCGTEGYKRLRFSRDADLLEEECCMMATAQQWHDFNKRSISAQSHSWSALQSFQGCIIDAYLLSLPCHVSRMHLMSTGGKRSTELDMLSIILSDTRPTSLRLCLKIYEGRGYIPILPLPALWAQGLTRLEIRINIVKQVFDVDECIVSHFTCHLMIVLYSSSCQVHVIEMLRQLSVTTFILEFRCSNRYLQRTEWEEDHMETYYGIKCQKYHFTEPDHRICYTRDTLLRQDLHQRVRDILAATPKLRQVTLMWARCDVSKPAQVVGIDLDNIPHSIDRPGDESDGWNKRDPDW